jgi:hypothetical protein
VIATIACRGLFLSRSVAADKMNGGLRSGEHMNTLTANIQREWLSRILDGSKKIEYRDAGPYWLKRSDKAGPPPFKLRLINGMRPDSPEATILVHKVDIDLLNAEIRFHLGKIIETAGWRNEWHRQYKPLPPDPRVEPETFLRQKLSTAKVSIDLPAKVFRDVSASGRHSFHIPADGELALKLNASGNSSGGPRPFKVKLTSGKSSIHVIAYHLYWEPFKEELTAFVLTP